MQRRLVEKYNVRVKQLEVSRLRGLRWTTATLHSYAEKRATIGPPPAAWSRAPQRAPQPAEGWSAEAAGEGAPAAVRAHPAVPTAPPAPPKNWLKLFLEESCDVTKQPADWVDMKTRPVPTRRGSNSGPAASLPCIPRADATPPYEPLRGQGPDGSLYPGFQTMLTAWCRERGCALPKLIDRGWVERLPPGVTFRDESKVRQVYGLTFRATKGARGAHWHGCRLHPSFYAYEALAVLAHMLVCFGSSVLLILIAVSTQQQWAIYTAPPRAYPAAPLMLWHDVVRPIPLTGATDVFGTTATTSTM